MLFLSLHLSVFYLQLIIVFPTHLHKVWILSIILWHSTSSGSRALYRVTIIIIKIAWNSRMSHCHYRSYPNKYSHILFLSIWLMQDAHPLCSWFSLIIPAGNCQCKPTCMLIFHFFSKTLMIGFIQLYKTEIGFTEFSCPHGIDCYIGFD